MDPAEKAAFAFNVRQHRALRGWSIRELAKQAGVATKTIENIEAGHGCSTRVEAKVAIALNALRSRLRMAGHPSDGQYKIVRGQDLRWYFGEWDEADRYHQRMIRADLISPSGTVAEDPEAIQDEAERRRLGLTGQASVFIQVRSGALTTGRYMTCMLELFARSAQAPDPSSYTYQIHILKGSVRFVMGDLDEILSGGDAIVFVQTDEFYLEPAEPLTEASEIPTYLTMRMATLPYRIPGSTSVKEPTADQPQT